MVVGVKVAVGKEVKYMKTTDLERFNEKIRSCLLISNKTTKEPVAGLHVDEVDYITGWTNAGWSKHGGGWINQW